MLGYKYQRIYLLVLLGILLVAHSHLCFGQYGHRVMSFPTRWSTPQQVEILTSFDPITHGSFVTAQVEMYAMDVRTRTKLGMTFSNCFSFIGLETETITTDIPYFTQDPTTKVVTIPFVRESTSPLAIYLKWGCTTATIKPNGDPFYTEVLIASSISFPPNNDKIHLDMIKVVVVKDIPSIHHHFSWRGSNGLPAPVIAVDFFVSIPNYNFHSNDIKIQHPLLSRAGMTALHHSSDLSKDLSLPFHLVPDRGEIGVHASSVALQCISFNPEHPNGTIIFNSEYNLGAILELPVENTPLVRDYSCKFTVYYSPEVLDRMTHPDSSLSKNIIIHISGSPHGGIQWTRPVDIPTVKPLLRSSIFGWVSPHHARQIDHFDVSIAKASLLELDDGQITDYPDAMDSLYHIFKLMNASTNEFFIDSFTMLCGYHGKEPFLVIPPDLDDPISLADPIFTGFGATCRVTLHNKDIFASTSLTGAIMLRGSSHNHLYPLLAYDALYRPVYEFLPIPTPGESQTPLIRNMIPLHNPLWTENHHPVSFQDDPTAFQLIELHRHVDVETPQRSLLRLTMNLQYLPPSPAQLLSPNEFDLHFVFVNQLSLDEIFPQDRSDVFVGVDMYHGGYLLTSYSTQPSYYAPSAEFLNISSPDAHQDIIASHRPIRAPSVIITFAVKSLDPTQPIQVIITFLSNYYPGTNTPISVFPILLPKYLSFMHVYMPDFALITPIRSTALTGFSFRCVSWENMTSAYVYGTPSIPLDNSNSILCKDPTGNGVDVTTDSTWNKRAYVEWGSSPLTLHSICLYEAAAVCVTPSADDPNVFIPHPLADCAGVVPPIHTISCGKVAQDPQSDEDSMFAIIQDSIKLIKSSENSGNTYLAFNWSYFGNRRAMTTVTARAFHSSDPNHTQMLSRWAQVQSNIPSYLPAMRSDPEAIQFLFPLFDPSMDRLEIRLDLHDGPSSQHVQEVVDYTVEATDIPGCSIDEYKRFDPDTHLCVCKEGYTTTTPHGVTHPTALPTSFECTPTYQCDDESSWNAKTKRCEPNVPEQTTCHTIPPHVVPPFQTNACGFGVPHGENCSECICLSRWMPHPDDSDSTRCSECRLEYGTDEERCIAGNTDGISYTPEYCWVGRCLCKPGYYGDKCEHKVMYGTLEYTKPVEAAEPYIMTATNTSTTTATSESEEVTILRRRQLLAVQDRIVADIKSAIGPAATDVHMFLQQATQRRVARSDNIDDGYDVITTLVIGMQPPMDSGSHGDGEDGTPFIHLANGDDFSSLYDAWQDLQDSGATNIPADPDFGQVEGIQPPYDPHCVPNEFTSCPEGENNLLPPASQVDPDELDEVYKEEEDPDNPIIDISDDDDDDNSKSNSNTTTYIIIGVVVGVVLLLFIALIVSILYCRKHDKMCFRKRRGKGGTSGDSRSVELASSSNNSKSNTNTPTSAPPPSSTMSTSSYLPTQVTVADPTLPADWIALEDKSTGKIYYSNKITMESSWDHPAKPKEATDTSNAYGW